MAEIDQMKLSQRTIPGYRNIIHSKGYNSKHKHQINPWQQGNRAVLVDVLLTPREWCLRLEQLARQPIDFSAGGASTSSYRHHRGRASHLSVVYALPSFPCRTRYDLEALDYDWRIMALETSSGYAAHSNLLEPLDSLPMFDVKHVQLQFPLAADFVAAQVADNVLILALSTGRILRIDLNNPEHIDGIEPLMVDLVW